MTRQNGKTLAQLQAAAAWRLEHPGKTVLYVCGTQAMCDYAKALAEHHGLADGIRFVSVTSAAKQARGRDGRPFIDHAAFEQRRLSIAAKAETLDALRHMSERSESRATNPGKPVGDGGEH